VLADGVALWIGFAQELHGVAKLRRSVLRLGGRRCELNVEHGTRDLIRRAFVELALFWLLRAGRDRNAGDQQRRKQRSSHSGHGVLLEYSLQFPRVWETRGQACARGARRSLHYP